MYRPKQSPPSTKDLNELRGEFIIKAIDLELSLTLVLRGIFNNNNNNPSDLIIDDLRFNQKLSTFKRILKMPEYYTFFYRIEHPMYKDGRRELIDWKLFLEDFDEIVYIRNKFAHNYIGLENEELSDEEFVLMQLGDEKEYVPEISKSQDVIIYDLNKNQIFRRKPSIGKSEYTPYKFYEIENFYQKAHQMYRALMFVHQKTLTNNPFEKIVK